MPDLPPIKGRWGAARAPIFFLLLMSVFFAGTAWGESYDVVPSLRVQQEFNDNVDFSGTSRKSALFTTIAPQIEFAKRDARTDAAASAGVSEVVSSNTNGSDTVLNQNYQGRLTYLLSERLNANLNAAYFVYDKSNSLTNNTDIVINANRHDVQNYSTGVAYAISEKDVVNFSYKYVQETYDNLSQLNYTNHNVSTGISHDLSDFFPDAKGMLGFYYGKYDYASSTSDNFVATVGLGYAINEKWAVSVDAGGRYTSSEFDSMQLVPLPPPLDTLFVLQPVRLRNNGVGMVADASLSVKSELTDGTLTFSRNVTVASSRSGMAETNSVDLLVHHFFSPKWSLAASLEYQTSKSSGNEFTASNIDEEYIRSNLSLRYEFVKNMALETAYSFTRANYRQSHVTADKNSFLVNLTIRHPFFDRW